FYYGFATGSRHTLATYVITFLCAYFLVKPELTFRQLVGLGLPALVLLLIAMIYMMEFRNVGLNNFSFEESAPTTVFMDHNLIIIARLTEIFPSMYDYLGLEVPYFGLIHPIPRALWPGKPTGLSVTIEAELGADPSTVTFASSFVGETYMAG